MKDDTTKKNKKPGKDKEAGKVKDKKAD